MRRPPLLCLVTDRAAPRHPLCEAVEHAVAAGVDRVQIRERELEGAALLEHAEQVAAAARAGAARRSGRVEVVVNRRVDVALSIDAAGVHLGFDAMPVAAARALLGAEAEVGISAHAVDELAPASRQGASYAHLAPIFAPLSKASERAALGTEVLAEACRGPLPIIAQGGIGAENVAEVLAAGAAGIAVIGAVLLADDPGSAAAALRRALAGRA